MGREYTTQPIEEIDKLDFKELLKNKGIEMSSHALDHICNQQRKIYIGEELTNLINKQNPWKVYKQRNGRLSIHYRTKTGYTEIILDIESESVVIVSFMNNKEMPQIRK